MNNRSDAIAKVTGRAIYTNDMRMPGMAFVKVVRSPYSHARILGIDMDGARQTKA
jgi:CO/xanthine dehydrogenase Mo-binding subunit